MRTALVYVRRFAPVGARCAAPSVKLVFEESTDEIDWSACDGGGPGGEIVCDADEAQFVVGVRKPRFRVRPLLVELDVEVHFVVRFDDGRTDGLRSRDGAAPETP